MKSIGFTVIYVCMSVFISVCDSNNYRRGHEFVGKYERYRGS